LAGNLGPGLGRVIHATQQGRALALQRPVRRVAAKSIGGTPLEGEFALRGYYS
jgi:hypothetical protein